MLKKRVIATLLVKNGIVVQSIGFNRYLPIGKPAIALEYLSLWGIDEVIILDISASKERREPDYTMLKESTSKCFVPLTIGGGINKLSDIGNLLNCGADKVSLNRAAILDPKIITTASEIYGNQCIVVSIDSIKTSDGYCVYDYFNKRNIFISPAEMAKKAQDAGAGEILINSVDKDGSYLGYDIELINSVCNEVSIPVLACGGAKNANDIDEVFELTRASAACAGNFFHFHEHSVIISKAFVSKKNQIRLDTHANYIENEFDEEVRLIKKADSVLEEMLFTHIEKEII